MIQKLTENKLFQQFNTEICLQVISDVYSECCLMPSQIQQHLGNLSIYDELAESLSWNILEDTFKKYTQWLGIKRQLYPVADHISSDICHNTCKLMDYSIFLTNSIVQNALNAIKEQYLKQNAISNWAGALSLLVLKESKHCLKYRSNEFNSCQMIMSMTMTEKLDKWASTFTTDLLSESREDLRSISGCMSDKEEILSNDGCSSSNNKYKHNFRRHSSNPPSSKNSNNSNNHDSSNKEYYQLNKFADQVMIDILQRKGLGMDRESVGDGKTTVKLCESCDSLISSELLSPHSAVIAGTNNGLDCFADKLLYSLSSLQNNSLEALNGE